MLSGYGSLVGDSFFILGFCALHLHPTTLWLFFCNIKLLLQPVSLPPVPVQTGSVWQSTTKTLSLVRR